MKKSIKVCWVFCIVLLAFVGFIVSNEIKVRSEFNVFNTMREVEVLVDRFASENGSYPVDFESFKRSSQFRTGLTPKQKVVVERLQDNGGLEFINDVDSDFSFRWFLGTKVFEIAKKRQGDGKADGVSP